ncbi:hypothetical protein CHL76_14975 [Marinococcus halophilus]|uniref:Transcriptional regulator n=1 Tax=Marinococcus halophilus TaxID=1371 RepID=A0A510YBL4_MARHA|nr:helix-turn-helix domain-containing protein [Marinococcus halophilus]OZT78984.1 hypothetical protein CHL76_14975 [Marinococcus halophilus]GEK60031.1 transcriptional regulator [Marinococcus halophilus]
MMDPFQAHCKMEVTLAVISGKWKADIVQMLSDGSPRRYGFFQKNLPEVTPKILTNQLRELENAGILTRVIYPEVPVRVEYQLTEAGLDLLPILEAMERWALSYIEKIQQRGCEM